MSSKIVPPGMVSSAGPMIWKQVDARDTAPEEPDADPAADELLRQMRQECEARVRDAHAAGFREGEAAGRESAGAETRPVMERMVRSIDEMVHLRARFRREAEGDMLRLSLAVARRVLRRELAIDPDAMHGLVLAALEKMQGQEICRVRVHPAHAPQVAAGLRELAAAAHVEVIADAAREPGALIFETERGNLDASVESQLQEIERGLVDRLERQS